MKTLAPFIAALVLSLSSVASGANQEKTLTLAEVLDAPHRPTMAEVKEIESLIPLGEYQKILQRWKGVALLPNNKNLLDFERWFKVLIAQAPTLIASLEQAVPGATWAFVGRDTQALADVLEAFYASIGQKDRVIRLGASKASFVGATYGTIVEYLKTHGFSLDHAWQAHPFILVDTVSSGGGRQGRMLLDAVYSEYCRRGGQPADLVRKFNMIGLIVSTFQDRPVPLKQAPSVFAQEEARYRKNPRRPAEGFGYRHAILHFVDESNQAANEAGYEHFTGAWHHSYGPMRVDESGRTIARPGKPHQLDLRQAILAFQKNILDAVQDPAFRKRVEAEANKIGFEFAEIRPAPAKLDLAPLSPERARSEKDVSALAMHNDALINDKFLAVKYENALNQHCSQLSPATNHVNDRANLEEFRRIYEQWLSSDNTPTSMQAASEALLNSVAYAVTNGFLRPATAVPFVAEILDHSFISSGLISAFKALARSHKMFDKMLQGDLSAERLMTGRIGETTFRHLVMALGPAPRSCAEIFSDDIFPKKGQ